MGLIPGLKRSPGGGNNNPFQYSCLENSMDREAWWATVHGVAQCQTWLKWLSTYMYINNTYYKKLTHMIVDAEMSQVLQLASWIPRRAGGVRLVWEEISEIQDNQACKLQFKGRRKWMSQLNSQVGQVPSCVCVCVRSHAYSQALSHVWLFVTPWTVACQAPLSMGFSRWKHWSGLPCPPPGDPPNPKTEPRSPVTSNSLPSEPSGKPTYIGVGSLSLLQGNFPTQELNQGLLHCR